MIKEILKRAKELGTIELIYTVADWCDKRIEGLGIFTRKAISDLEQNGLKLESLLGRLQKSTEKEIENVRTSTNKEVKRLDTKDLELEEKTVKIEEAVVAVNEKIDEYPTQNIVDSISLKLEALQLHTNDVADDLDKKIGKVEKIKGERGEKGEKGDKGDKGEKGDRGLKGKDGKDGKDGSPDTAKGIKEKLETLKGDKRLDASAIKNIPISIGGGARAFTALKDTPSSYDGSGGKLVKVKADGTGLEFGESGEVDETDPVWTSEKVNYYTKTESDIIYEPILPATPADPATKYLNGNKEWAVAIGETDRIVIDNITPQTFTLTRTDGSVSKIEYNNGRTVNITRSDGAISYWEDENWRWTINRTDDTITGITVTEV